MPGMRRSTKSELRMLREIVWHFCTIKKCFFCKQPLLEMTEKEMRFGRRDFPPVKVKLAIHHEDENRRNNSRENRKPAHSKCHRRHHIKQLRKKGGLG